MPKGPNDSPIKVTPEMEEQIANALSAEEIKQVFRTAMLEQNIVDADPYDNSILHVREEAAPTAPAASSTRFGAKVTIDGKVHIAEGRTQEEADQKIVEVIRAVTHPTTRDDQGRFSATQGRTDEATAKAIEQELLRKSELELKFKRGEISSADYLNQSGAVEQFFANKGIALSDVEAAAQKTAGERLNNDWATATTEFMKSPEGRDWPGGEANKLKMLEVLESMDATDAPNPENLRRAYGYMKQNNLLVTNPELERDQAILAATTPEEIAAALHGGKLKKAGSSSTWTTRTWNGHG